MEELKKHPFDYKARDKYYWEKLEDLKKMEDISLADVLQNWPSYVRRRELPRFLAHYEIFKNVIDLPGCIVELGVYKGASFFTWTKLLETFCPGDRYRKVYGFDHFEGLVDFSDKDGEHRADYYDKQLGGWKASANHAKTLVHLTNEDSMMPGISRCELIEGNILETLPRFIDENPGLRISLLHFDVDVYEPTKFALDLLYPKVVKGGAIIFDEYGLMPWEGESIAVEEYFDQMDSRPVLKKFPFAIQPHGYFIK